VDSRARVLAILTRAQLQGLLGPGDPSVHLAHALGFADAALSRLPRPPARFADLGTGGGVPGLVLASEWTECEAGLVESRVRRCALLRTWVDDLDLTGRVEVLEGRAEDLAQDPGIRESFDLVTARSFARPAVTAEIAAGLVKSGGLLVVSEPPDPAPERWPEELLGDLGFAAAVSVEAGGAHYVCVTKIRDAAANVPRKAGKPAKQPLW